MKKCIIKKTDFFSYYSYFLILNQPQNFETLHFHPSLTICRSNSDEFLSLSLINILIWDRTDISLIFLFIVSLLFNTLITTYFFFHFNIDLLLSWTFLLSKREKPPVTWLMISKNKNETLLASDLLHIHDQKLVHHWSIAFCLDLKNFRSSGIFH